MVDELPTVAYTPAALDLTNNTVSGDLPLAPTITGAGEITSWEINATLPDGLSFGATNGTILEHQLSCGLPRLTWFGRTIAVAQA